MAPHPGSSRCWVISALSSDGADTAGFMLFDTVLAFDHVQHRILIIANARITPDEDLESSISSLAQDCVPRTRAGSSLVAAPG